MNDGVNQLQTRLECAQDQIDSLLPLKEQAKIVSEKLGMVYGVCMLHDNWFILLWYTMICNLSLSLF
ncbi:hypothetical protein EON63_11970 [archaeon]|nr:MAG: hypothetical protein EON63_11970 [archaeon]